MKYPLIPWRNEMSMPYESLTLPEPPEHRPFVFLNMVCTIDGKIVTGERNEPVMDLGSRVDHAAMRHLESLANAVILGAGSLRATPGLWYPEHLVRIVATSTGNVPWESRFFTDCPEQALVVSIGAVDAAASLEGAPSGFADCGSDVVKATANLKSVDHEASGSGDAGAPEASLFPGGDKARGKWARLNGVSTMHAPSWRELFAMLRRDRSIRRLLVEGGAELNAQLFRENLVDEIFLTVAPKVKLGRGVPTMADGIPFSREEVQTWELLSVVQVENEVFLRYRKPRLG